MSGLWTTARKRVRRVSRLLLLLFLVAYGLGTFGHHHGSGEHRAAAPVSSVRAQVARAAVGEAAPDDHCLACAWQQAAVATPALLHVTVIPEFCSSEAPVASVPAPFSRPRLLSLSRAPPA